MAIHPLLPHSRPRRLFGHVATMCGVGAVALGLLAPGLLGSGLLGSGLLASGPTRVQAVPRTVNQQRIFVSVVDKEGVPTPTLTPDDLTIKEDGRSREVLTVEPATEAMQIALLVDTSAVTTTAIRDIRLGLKAFSVAIWEKSPDTQIALFSFGERPTLLADFSSSAVLLDRQINRLFATTGSGAYFIDAVIEAAAVLGKRGASRSVVVAYVDENGPEFSNRRSDYTFKAISAAHTSLWVVARQGFGSNASTPENIERAMVIGDVTTRSGGRSSTVLNGTAIPARLTDVAVQLLGQFAVTYGRPESLVPPDQLEVKLTNSDLRLAAPRWTSR
ncbi:MAG: hypothetical protein HQ485_03195 [Acidobacteria bacterium]|nr:hypothetical protein [Acidobacteriota bacterium]